MKHRPLGRVSTSTFKDYDHYENSCNILIMINKLNLGLDFQMAVRILNFFIKKYKKLTDTCHSKPIYNDPIFKRFAHKNLIHCTFL